MTPAASRIITTCLLLFALVACRDGPPPAAIQIIHMADLHSAVDQYPGLLGTLNRLQAEDPATPRVILINGDLFEAGDPMAARSGGQLDWTLLERLRGFGPVVFNIGNHEFDLIDPEELVSRAAALDVHLVGNVALANGDSVAPPSVDVSIGGFSLRVVGVTTDQLATWPARLRDGLELTDPGVWIEQQWQRLTAGAENVVLASHAGLEADLAISKALASGPRPLLFFGAHDHLLLEETVAGVPYVHSGSGAEHFTVASIRLSSERDTAGEPEVTLTRMAARGPEDGAMAEAVQQLRDTTLTAAERRTVGRITEAMTLPAAARWASRQLQQDPELDAVFLNHTSFGAGLPAGDLSRYRFDRFLRFDNGLMQVQVDAATLRSIIDRASPQQAMPLAERSGDTLHGAWPEPEEGRHYRLLTSDWIALPANQTRYLGASFDFEPVPGTSIKARLLQALQPDTR
ncbi:MAG: bifunctional metallophosphatase/5'-nucleotidase [Gammaproteobacteria bacterium]|nr:bifunctional metallophosphatase/5'-nucleotidase [Gammaproteobacteria bacterium]